MKIKYANDKSIWNLTESAGVPLLVSPLLEETGIVKQGFSTKLGGVSKGDCATMNISTTRGDDPEAVNENEDLRRQLVWKNAKWYTNQTHTTNVAVVDEANSGED